MKRLIPGLTVGLAAIALAIMFFPTWPVLYGLHTSIHIRWMSMFTIIYFEWEPLAAFILTLAATCMTIYAMPGQPSTRIPSLLFFGASLSALIGTVDGSDWTPSSVVVMALLISCGILARRERRVMRIEQS